MTGFGKDKAVAVSCGAEFTMLLTDKGQLWAFGSPEYGQVKKHDAKGFSSARKLISHMYSLTWRL